MSACLSLLRRGIKISSATSRDADDLAGGVIFGIADDLDAAAIFRNRIALGNGVRGVVRALGLNVGANLADDRAHIELGKDHDRIHVRERGDNFGAFFRGHDGTAFALQRAHRSSELIATTSLPAQSLRSAQIAHMPHMQQIEAAIGQRDAFAGAPPLFDALAQFFAAQNFSVLRLRSMRSCRRRRLVNGVQQFVSARRSPCRASSPQFRPRSWPVAPPLPWSRLPRVRR